MTIETFFLMIVSIYLVLIAYGVIGARRRGLGGRVRIASGALTVAIPPLAILGALYATGDAALMARWSGVTLAMLAGGVAVAVVADVIARRVGA